MDPYKEQFLSGIEGAPRAAVKRLTYAMEAELLEATINAPDWYLLQFRFSATSNFINFPGIPYTPPE